MKLLPVRVVTDRAVIVAATKFLGQRELVAGAGNLSEKSDPVSDTNLTLPTTYAAESAAVAGTTKKKNVKKRNETTHKHND